MTTGSNSPMEHLPVWKAMADAFMESIRPHTEALIMIVKKAVRPYMPYHRSKFRKNPKRRALRK
jgi:hypothetical protein